MKFVSHVSFLFVIAGLCIAAEGQTSAHFAAYSRCKFADDLALVENTPLAKGIEGRTVKTIMGPRQVPLEGGVRLMYSYPGTEPLANVKVEQIPADGYAQAKQDLIANFQQILTGDDSSTRNYALKPRLNGLEIYGLDRKELEGGVLGIYLFFVDRSHTATTVYFLNQDPAVRKFASLQEYARLRDAFLETYTGCAGGHARPVAPAELIAETTMATESAAVAAGAPSAAITTTTASPASALPDAPLPQGAAAQQTAPPVAPATARPTPATKHAVAANKHPAGRQAAKGARAQAKKPSTKKKAAPGKKPVKKKH